MAPKFVGRKMMCDAMGLRHSDQRIGLVSGRPATCDCADCRIENQRDGLSVSALERILNKRPLSLAESYRLEYAALAAINERNAEFWAGGAR